MAIGMACCLENSHAKALNYSVEARLKSAETSTRSHWNHLSHIYISTLCLKKFPLLYSL